MQYIRDLTCLCRTRGISASPQTSVDSGDLRYRLVSIKPTSAELLRVNWVARPKVVYLWTSRFRGMSLRSNGDFSDGKTKTAVT